MDAAMAGASIGVLGAAMGADPNAIRNSVSEGSTSVAQSNADAQRQFANSMAAAGAPGYGGGNSAASSGATRSSDGASAQGSPQPDALPIKRVQVYLRMGMQVTAKNTRNPVCYSNTFSVDIPFDPKGWGNPGRLQAALAPMMDTFSEKCARLGQPGLGPPSYGASDNIGGSFPRATPHAEDYVVTMP
jgi:hypothetical protein